MAEVRFEHVYKLFEERVVVHDLSLEIADGEFLVLLGPSGCGKTTSLRMLAGLERPTYGRIMIGQRTVNALPPKARDIAMVFQNYALFPHKTVRGNLAFGMELRRIPKGLARLQLEEVAGVLGLDRLLDKRPSELSGGERQRVALGRALLRRPQVFLMDEPLSNLDATLRAQMRAELIRLHTRFGATILYVTHDQAEAMTMATRIAVMSKGRLVQVGTPQQIYDDPADLFVATFVGLPRMNVLPGQVLPGKPPELQVLGLRIPLDPAAFQSPHALEASSDVLVGIRPEDVLCEVDGSGTGMGMAASVEVVEPLGSELLVTVRCTPDTSLVARAPPRSPIVIGGKVFIRLNTQHLHLFDKGAECSLLRPRAEPLGKVAKRHLGEAAIA
jgi:multiple sugar transport system ATP-binding protein